MPPGPLRLRGFLSCARDTPCGVFPAVFSLQVRNLMPGTDEDGDGEVSFQEFMNRINEVA